MNRDDLELAPARAPFSQKWLYLVSALIVSGSFALMAWFALSFHYQKPVFEHFHIVNLLGKVRDGTYRLGDASQIYGGNWYFFGVSLAVFLAYLTHWNFTVEVLCILLIIAASFFVWVVIYRSALKECSVAVQAAFFIFSGALFFSLNQAVNLLWPWQIAAYLHNFGLLLCIGTLTATEYRLRHFVLAVAGMLLAVYDLTSGLALLPVYVFFLALHPSGQRYLMAWGAISLAVFFHHLIIIPQTFANPIVQWEFSVVFFHKLLYFLLYNLGAPVASPRWVGGKIFLGVVALGIWFFVLFYVIKRRRNAEVRDLLPVAALMSAVVAAYFIIVLGRYQWSIGNFGIARYQALGNLFWLSAGVAYVNILPRLRVRGKMHLLVFPGMALFLVTVVSLQQGNAVERAAIEKKQAAKYNHKAQRMREQWPTSSEKEKKEFTKNKPQYFDEHVKMYEWRVGLFRNIK